MSGRISAAAVEELTMPFRSTAQRGYLFANHPDIAKRFAAECDTEGREAPRARRRQRRRCPCGRTGRNGRDAPMKFSAAHALRRDIAAAALDVAKTEHLVPRCVVVTREQYGALLAVLNGPRLPVGNSELLVMSDESLGKPLPDGQWQILEFIPRATNSIARATVNGVVVSTIDLAHGLPFASIPTHFPPGEMRYETHATDMEDGGERRYETRDEALAGHAEEVARLRGAERVEALRASVAPKALVKGPT
jgi:hypothetical protein